MSSGGGGGGGDCGNNNNNGNSWNKKEWFKKVLSKSGTDIMEIKDEKTKEICNMVYYPSLPLIMKSEPKHELCTQLAGETQMYQNAAVFHHHQQQQQQQQQNQEQHQQHHQQQSHEHHQHQPQFQPQQSHHQGSSSSNISMMSSNQNFIHNIKIEKQNQQEEQLHPHHQPHQQSSSQQNLHLNHSSSINGNSNGGNGNGGNGNNGNSSSVAYHHNAIGKVQYKCEQCNMIFGSKGALTSHMKSHIKHDNSNGSNSNYHNLTPPPASPNVTSTILPTHNGQISVTVATVSATTTPTNSGSDPYQCNVCQKTFAVPARLIRHYRTHTGERPFECEYCHKTFSVKENLQVHRRIHTKERPYKCDVCGRAFEHSGKLHRHMRIHTGERPHKCSVCNKTFIQSGQLVIHMRTHTGEKPYKCPVEGCGKGFTCSKQLKVHSRTHTGEKPYHCDICFRDFGYNHVLKLHRVQHYGSKCYKCTICDETFKSKKEMEAHIKGHANEIPDDDDEQQNTTTSGTASAASAISTPASTTTPTPTTPLLTHQSHSQPPMLPLPQKHQQQHKSSSSSPLSSSFSSTSSSSSSSRFNHRLDLMQQHETEKSRDSIGSNLLSSSSLSIKNRICGKILKIETPMETSSEGANSDSVEDNINLYGQMYQRFEQNGVSFTIQSAGRINDGGNQHNNNCVSGSSGRSTGCTINPALLAAASIASRRIEEKNEIMIPVTATTRLIEIPPSPTSTTTSLELISEQTNDAIEMNDELYKRQTILSSSSKSNSPPAFAYESLEAIRQRAYLPPAPVAEFRSSLRAANDIVRQVEAAIAGAEPSLLTPPRSSSTESPEERSSSPESDSIMMVADRDIMTLPLRKRKLYLKDNNNGQSKDVSPVMRMNSVIQFARAS